MTTPQHEVHTQPGRAAVQIFAANDRINQILIEHLDPSAWRAKPPGKTRTIAAIFHAHAQCPHQVGQAYSSAAQPDALHTAAGSCGTGRERRTLRGDARTSARIRVAGRGGVWPVELGKAVEGMRGAWRPRLRS